MESATTLSMSAGTMLETLIVVDGLRDVDARAAFTALLELLAIEIVPTNAHQVELAHEAHRRFGRGNHPAKLNFGDCFAYALAKATGEPLLFVGNDFSQTDIPPA